LSGTLFNTIDYNLSKLMEKIASGELGLPDIHPHFEDYTGADGARVLTVECDPSRTPVFVKDGAAERFFVRYGPSTQGLTGATAQDFIRQRFG
jgi:hypothetical protein